MAAVVDELVASYRLDKADAVLLTGCSAGGLGTFFNVDWLAARLPEVTVRGNPQAGWFGVPIPGWEARRNHDRDEDPSHFKMVSWILNIDFLRFPALVKCEADTATGTATGNTHTSSKVIFTTRGRANNNDHESDSMLPLRQNTTAVASSTRPLKACVYPPIFYKYITTPLFISENTADA